MKIYKWKMNIWKDVQHYMSLGKHKFKKQLHITTHPLEWKKKKIQNPDNIKCWWECETTGTLLIADGNTNGTAILEDGVAVSAT